MVEIPDPQHLETDGGQTVKELVAGSGFSFTDTGEHQLKGIPQSYHLCAAS
jgi:hypothetical protein